jgi:hypothetical protein
MMVGRSRIGVCGTLCSVAVLILSLSTCETAFGQGGIGCRYGSIKYRDCCRESYRDKPKLSARARIEDIDACMGGRLNALEKQFQERCRYGSAKYRDCCRESYRNKPRLSARARVEDIDACMGGRLNALEKRFQVRCRYGSAKYRDCCRDSYRNKPNLGARARADDIDACMGDRLNAGERRLEEKSKKPEETPPPHWNTPPPLERGRPNDVR